MQFSRDAPRISPMCAWLLVLAGAEVRLVANFGQVAAVRELYLERFLPISGGGKINRIRKRSSCWRIDRNKFVALAHLYFAKNLQILARAALFADAGFLMSSTNGSALPSRMGSSGFEFDDGVIDAYANKRRQQVARCRNEHAPFS